MNNEHKQQTEDLIGLLLLLLLQKQESGICDWGRALNPDVLGRLQRKTLLSQHPDDDVG